MTFQVQLPQLLCVVTQRKKKREGKRRGGPRVLPPPSSLAPFVVPILSPANTG
jgi:hypothetical protein